MFQCGEQVEMNKFLCSLACTCMTIIDSQFYIIDSLHWNEMLNWWLPGCKPNKCAKNHALMSARGILIEF